MFHRWSYFLFPSARWNHNGEALGINRDVPRHSALSSRSISTVFAVSCKKSLQVLPWFSVSRVFERILLLSFNAPSTSLFSCSFSRTALWIGTTSFMILVLPVVFETERLQLEQQQLQQQRQVMFCNKQSAPLPQMGIDIIFCLISLNQIFLTLNHLKSYWHICWW